MSDARIVVVGGGSWGTAVAVVLAGAGHRVRLVCRSAEQAAAITASRRNARYLPDLPLPAQMAVGHLDDGHDDAGAELFVVATPSRAIAQSTAWVASRVGAGAGVLSLTKGLEPATGRRISERWREALPPGTAFCVLSGPSHAEEVAAGQPAAAVVAGDPDLCARVQELASGPRFRVYRNHDLAGVELGGAAKNVIALAAGMSDGLGFGDNTKAALITRGLAEMTRLGVACGARPQTYLGLAGVGDLVATCTSEHSRNLRAGRLIAAGVAIDELEARIGQTTEGPVTVLSLLALAGRRGVELPITAEVDAVIHRSKAVADSMRDLMARAPAQE